MLEQLPFNSGSVHLFGRHTKLGIAGVIDGSKSAPVILVIAVVVSLCIWAGHAAQMKLNVCGSNVTINPAPQPHWVLVPLHVTGVSHPLEMVVSVLSHPASHDRLVQPLVALELHVWHRA
jgi:hypothetical protein